MIKAPLQSHLFRPMLLGSLCLLLISLATTAIATPRQDYWLLQDYLEQHPDQRALDARFREQVKQPPVRLRSPPPGPVRIIALYPGHQISDYWRRSLQVLELRLAELGIPYQLKTFMTRPALEPELQEQQLDQALAQKPDYLITTLDSPRHQRMIERTLAKENTRLIIQNMTTPIKAWVSNPPLLYVGFDHHQGTQLLSQAIFERHPPEQTAFSVLFWEQGYVSDARGKGFINQLKVRNSAPVSQFYTHANRESARVAALEAIERNPELNFIYACATDVALGALDALKERGRLQNTGVNGWGGGAAELAAIAAGELELTVMRINDDNGIAMAEAIKNDLQNIEVPQVFSGRFAVITRDTPKQEISRLKGTAFRYSDRATPSR